MLSQEVTDLGGIQVHEQINCRSPFVIGVSGCSQPVDFSACHEALLLEGETVVCSVLLGEVCLANRALYQARSVGIEEALDRVIVKRK